MDRILLVLVGVFTLLSGACYTLVAEVDTLSCDREVGTCLVTQEKPYRTSVQSFRVQDLSGAALRPLPGPTSDDAADATVRVVLLTKSGAVPFMGYATAFGFDELEAHVNAISRYAAAPGTRRLDLRRDNRRGAALMALAPLALAGALLAAAVRTRRRRPA